MISTDGIIEYFNESSGTDSLKINIRFSKKNQEWRYTVLVDGLGHVGHGRGNTIDETILDLYKNVLEHKSSYLKSKFEELSNSVASREEDLNLAKAHLHSYQNQLVKINERIDEVSEKHPC